ncbi:putative ribonuclease H-like domain-containing protein [Tanacetum coccineum]
MTRNRSQLMNFVSKFLGTVQFSKDQVAKIMGYGDYQQGNVIIPGNLEGVDLLSSSQDTNLYTISLDDMLKTSPICLLSKASNTKSWLWHRCLSHLNFGTLNKLAKYGLTRGIPKLKFQKDHLFLAYALGKCKKSSHQPKAVDTSQEKLYLLYMDLCGPICVESINRKKSKDGAPDAITKCIKNIQVRLNATVHNVRTDNGTKFVNQTLHDFYENVGILHQTLVARTPQQNDIVKRRNQTLVEAARTIRDDWDTLFQPLFDEYFNPPTIAVSTVPVAAASRAVEIADSPVSTSIDQDAPSSKNGKSWVSVPQTPQENGTSVTKMSVPVTDEEKTNKKNDVKARSLLLMVFPMNINLLSQQYENFSASSTESLDSIFNRLQKIVSKLAILGVVISQEDLNSNFLSSLPPEWNTHVVVWMNKAEIKTMSIDDLYNNFKIVKQSVKKSVGAISGAQNSAFMTAPSTSSTNDANTAKPAYEVSNASFSDNVVYAFMIENHNGSNLLQQDLKQIHEDDLEATDLKNQDNTRKQGNNEDTSSKAILAIDGVGFNWSDMAEEQVQTNMALMAFSDSEVYNDKTCSKTCLKNYETLRKQYDDLIVNQTKFTAATYKRGLSTVEEQLITYRKNEVLFNEEVAVLKREVACKDYEINVLKSEFEKVKQENVGIEFKIEKFDKASKDLDKLLGSQITDKSKKGLGYNVVPPPHILIYNRPKKLDLSDYGLD